MIRISVHKVDAYNIIFYRYLNYSQIYIYMYIYILQYILECENNQFNSGADEEKN